MPAKKPSAKIQRQTVVSGIQPSGRLHVGNYVGAVRSWLKLQDDPKFRCLFFIADWHSMTVEYDQLEKRRQIFDLAADLLALGLDPKKITLFRQSDILEHAELAWIFNTLTPMGYLERMTQYKDKTRQWLIQRADNRPIDPDHAKLAVNNLERQIANAGLFTYPVLMAADILIYKAAFVPVGVDQVQHVELTRDVAGFFNNRFGQTFPETKPLLTDTPKVRSLSEPTRKMSKSHGDRSCLYLTETFDEMYDKVKRVPTEPTGILSMDERAVEEGVSALADKEPDEKLKGMAGVWNLLQLIRIFGSEKEFDRLIAGQPLKYGELKRLVATRVAEHFSDFRAKRAKLEKQPGRVWSVLDDGAKKARAEARKTMKEVRQKIGLK
ncbi:tryptophan--tRNA ligase [Candidatus Uhrbacteria bacterium RIFCSPHIGHO2_02_FULL_60_10]|uniref:Tryptophan--tRNA ligase n=1 Tax=Candidatus Uhrbacteria bacterium RIFCSPHIGHO2_02_FULL_60_10 TaxID=1802392 RepID=A0A1F7U789_9BACT|nr:MAG: tryptophan--tRNA ligase [Candidatus Uhrbacteria bacterium RIFCSPHIGHO2_02_FULL_60_10]